ncbi:Uncharacterized protein AWRI3579_g69 [Hanseniaspora osmophila]|uniref:Uncharacterized protein n=1 Tax=Hanseniaspora osmophila TaxID=56408 RepID=A0A1E5S0G4_9ASCO|nr:Uncharacterized protein AWRI3579_g69 [Hanseniaspora osmophila]
MDPSQINKSTPSLIGMSVRQCDDVENSDYPEIVASNYHAHGNNGASSSSLDNPQTTNGNRPYSKDFLSNKDHFKKSSSFVNDSNNEYDYTTVNELDQEGALLTDEYLGTVDTENVVLKPMKSPHEDYNTEESKLALRKRLNLLKRRQSEVQNSVNQLSAASSNVEEPGASGTVTHKHDASDRITHSTGNSMHVTPVTSSSNTLATTTDPYEDVIDKPPHSSSSSSPSSSANNANAGIGQNGEEQIRNSYGEYILNKSHKPHLARGDSYQSNASDVTSSASTTDLLEHSLSSASLGACASGTVADRNAGDRVGRGHHQHVESNYLRELNRSLSRDPALKNKHIHAHDGAGADDDHSSSSTSVNNYHISKNDMEHAINSNSHNHTHAGNHHLKNEIGKKQTMNSTTGVSEWKIEEEEEEEEDNAADGQEKLDFEKEEGVLLNDQDGGMENKPDMLSS